MKKTFNEGDIVIVQIDGLSHYGEVRQVHGTIINVKPDGLPAQTFHINAVEPTNRPVHFVKDNGPIPYEEGMMREIPEC